jgi:hypothetical protein
LRGTNGWNAQNGTVVDRLTEIGEVASNAHGVNRKDARTADGPDATEKGREATCAVSNRNRSSRWMWRFSSYRDPPCWRMS